ncbi:hypothetical protein [Paenisporosarcina cavernae]|uniref:Uncharacterized protein n=1 Tax=Paenisporosarcina cavernae TaxID=2320858 RepID=A0A385YUW3_9BACL|nr:hypothetical protein [Paenisporosarcina cavernae]AYC30476.1 hypothetical protein D3873_11775 [Paenisporosarcina cavernae]
MDFETTKWVLLGIGVLLFFIKFMVKKDSLLWGLIFYIYAFSAIAYYVYNNDWSDIWKLLFLLVASIAFWQFLFKEIGQFKRNRVRSNL